MEALFALGNKFHDVYSFEAEIAALDQQIQLIEAAQAQQQQEQQRLQALVRERDAARNKLAATMDALVDAAAVALRELRTEGPLICGLCVPCGILDAAAAMMMLLQQDAHCSSERRTTSACAHAPCALPYALRRSGAAGRPAPGWSQLHPGSR